MTKKLVKQGKYTDALKWQIFSTDGIITLEDNMGMFTVLTFETIEAAEAKAMDTKRRLF
jgi:hypothetical protein